MNKLQKSAILVTIFAICLSGCSGASTQNQISKYTETPSQTPTQSLLISQSNVTTTPLPTRPPYSPGELVDYIAQSGDSLPALASHFNTTVAEILAANNFIPPDATTMPPGMPMKMPIYYQPFWGSQYQILPDSLFINGPAQIGFDTSVFVSGQPGWLSKYTEYAFGGNRTGAEIID
jgi:LasA protease